MRPRYLPLQSELVSASGLLTGADKMLFSDRILTASPTDVSAGISITAHNNVLLGKMKPEFSQMHLSKPPVGDEVISSWIGWFRSRHRSLKV
ncbi:SNF1-related protein kinase regulatory subunit gamma-1-like [Pyrus ussuriensis x Pyrus communis]|uniref:SNF1-related protein kinase regulatory subunit gamma-1-like n=1 Tax=Pyrus ussuriensis x Pyrus communis TaxID=2448454 RepID=A0A5N5H9I3_9ROSA|nr:SNF1-related protein kinase regulatory subunit gamma-1-like [Pyrus ussuriensis x Pyrus communis]